jgi:hypothetical protein
VLTPIKERIKKKDIKKDIYAHSGEKHSRDEQAEELFLELWEQYPKKRGKGKVTKEAKRELLEAGIEKVSAAIEEYKKQIERYGTEEQFVMYGSTFFNGGWKDYLNTTCTAAKTEASVEDDEEKETPEQWLERMRLEEENEIRI